MATPIQSPSYNNWVKASEGLVECGLLAAKIVESKMCQWHRTETDGKEAELKCAGDASCKPELKKNIPNRPKPIKQPNKQTTGKGYCEQCLKWGQDQIPNIVAKDMMDDVRWQLVKSSDFFGSAIQVTKLFGLKNISATDLAAITDFGSFDCAWLLSIMEKVNLFHEGDVQQQVMIYSIDEVTFVYI